MLDYFWQVVVGNQCSHVTRLVLKWFGYEGEYRTQKQNFIKMLKNTNIEYHELSIQDKEIGLYPTIQEELQLLPHEGAKSRSKFLIMEPKNLKRAIMQLKTKNGNVIRDYYIDLEELLKLYVEYTLYFNHRESQRKITNLEQTMIDMKLANKRQEETLERQEQIMLQQTTYMRSLGIKLEDVQDQNEELLDETKGLKKQNEKIQRQTDKIQRKLGIAVEDRAPLPEDKSKQERFVLLKRNDPEFMSYYTIRAQNGYTTRKIKSQRELCPNLEILLDFKAHIKFKTLYVRIKDKLKAEGVVFKGNNIDLEDSLITEHDLINEMKVINDQKYDV
jgi:hypothetical protein